MYNYLKRFGLLIVFAWFFVGGVTHFTSPDFFVAIVPPWVPWPVAAVYVSGVLEVVLAAMLCYRPLRSMAGIALVLLTLAVTPANIHMWLHPELFPGVAPAALDVRLVVQVALLALIWWSTRPSVGATEQPSNGVLSH